MKKALNYNAGVFKLQHITRYHLSHLSRTQNVAEHSFNMALLAWSNALWIINRYDDEISLNVSPYRVLTTALHHDFWEQFTGDIDYRVKAKNPDLNEVLQSVEYQEQRMFYETIPNYLRQPIEDPFGPITLHEKPWSGEVLKLESKIVKTADILALTWYCLEELQRGNRNVISFFQRGIEIFKKEAYDPRFDHIECPFYEVAQYLESELEKISGQLRHGQKD